MKQHYLDFNFRQDTLYLIDFMNKICDDYIAQGYVLTVRQLYYQLVAKAVIENTEKSYKRITGIVNDARLAGLMDWSAIEDRTRSFVERNHWSSTSSIVRACAEQYYVDMWANQSVRPFVIVEKEALAGVLERVCNDLDVPLLAARGYPSGTVLREFAVDKLIPAQRRDLQKVVVFHLGDHDPSGIDMSRDLSERLSMFCGFDLRVKRIALTMEQIEELNPPPNPAKTTDSRFRDYMRKFGNESWELDALPPSYLSNLVDMHVTSVRRDSLWQEKMQEVADGRSQLKNIAKSIDKR